jgi:hypothetical protein
MIPVRWGTSLRVALLSAAALLAGGATAHAQTFSTACVDAIPDSALVATVLFLHPSEPRDLDRNALAQLDGIDLLTQLLADRLRGFLHAAPGTVPAGEPTITWRTFDVPVLVDAHRDGRFVARVSRDSAGRPTGAPRSVLSTVLDSLHADGERFLWSEAPKSDSVAFSLELVPVTFGTDGKITPPAVRLGIPIATIMAPRMQGVQVLEMKKPRRPEFERRDGYYGTIVMDFVVDTSGHAVRESIRDVSRPRLSDGQIIVYDAYVAAVRRVIEGATFAPARVSRCAVNRVTRQSFEFAKS